MALVLDWVLLDLFGCGILGIFFQRGVKLNVIINFD